MNWDQIEGNWNTYKGMVKERWGDLTHSQLDVISGKRDQLIGQLQKTYGVARDEAEEEVADFLSKVKTADAGDRESDRRKRAS